MSGGTDKLFQRTTLWGARATDGHSNEIKAVKQVGGDLDPDQILNLRVLLRAIDSGLLPVALRALTDGADAQAPINAEQLLATIARLQLFDGVNFDRARSASAAVQALVADKTGVLVAAKESDWGQSSVAGVGVQASTVRAAVVGARHVCTSVTFCIQDGNGLAVPSIVELLDGAGRVWATYAPNFNGFAGQIQMPVTLSNLSIVGSVNTSMTLRFNAAVPLAFQSVSMTGYTTI